MNKFDKLPQLSSLGFYHPKYIHERSGSIENDYFNEFSYRILAVKNRDYTATLYFRDILLKLIEDEEIAIATVPAHTPFELNSGIRDLAGYLVKSKKNYIDAVQCLERFKPVAHSSQTRGFRSKQIHLESIRIIDRQSIENKNVILMDDVLTTGSSINACKELLQEAGAKEVKVLCLGKTIREVGRAHYLIDENLEIFLEEIGIEAYYNRTKIEEEYAEILDASIREFDDNNDEESLFDLECAIAEERQGELDNINHLCDDTESYYYESANEAHQALNGVDYLTPENPFVSILLADILQ